MINIFKQREVEAEVETEPAHKHDWELVFKTEAQPIDFKSSKIKEVTESAVLGCTEFYYECTCGESKTVRMLGQEVDDSELGLSFELADKYGHSFVEHAGKKYVVMPTPERFPVRKTPPVVQSPTVPTQESQTQ